ncbi:MAG: hypothetical protein ABEJ98_05605 [Candidatus Nanohaloarchaea archaeon]
MSASLKMLLHSFEEFMVATTAIFNTKLSATPLRAGSYAAVLTTVAGSLYFQAGEKVEEKLELNDSAAARV